MLMMAVGRRTVDDAAADDDDDADDDAADADEDGDDDEDAFCWGPSRPLILEAFWGAQAPLYFFTPSPGTFGTRYGASGRTSSCAGIASKVWALAHLGTARAPLKPLALLVTSLPPRGAEAIARCFLDFFIDLSAKTSSLRAFLAGSLPKKLSKVCVLQERSMNKSKKHCAGVRPEPLLL